MRRDGKVRVRGSQGILRIAVVAAAAGTALASMPADTRAQQLEIGARVGVSTTTVAWSESPVGTELENVQRRRGVAAGIALGVRSGRLWGRLEALYTQKGFREASSDEETSLDVDYLEVPVLIGVSAGPSEGRVVPELFAGPWIAWEARCRVAGSSGGLSVAFDCDEVPDDPVLRRTVDWGVTVGGGLSVRDVGPFRASIDLRYSAGLRNVDAESEVDNIDAHNRGVFATLGLFLPLGS